MPKIVKYQDLNKIYDYQMSFDSPFFLIQDFEVWRESYIEDVDGNGRKLFKELVTKAVYEENEIVGFIQYGKSAFGFDSEGNISDNMSYNIIRNLYFNDKRVDVGKKLLNEALDAFGCMNKIYAYFHYFGMSCYARHGKLFEGHVHINDFLKANGFEIEHENIYYASFINNHIKSEAIISPKELTRGNQQYIDFYFMDNQVGGCEIHFPSDEAAYLRWIYINENITGKGIGSMCMNGLKQWLYEKGIRRFDTDTAISNNVAQHFYEKNGFERKGITRSYFCQNNIVRAHSS